MTSILEQQAPDSWAQNGARLIAMSGGSAGRAIAFADWIFAKLEDAGGKIMRQGDPTNTLRSDLATELGKKNAAERYSAFLDVTPSLVARRARELDGRTFGTGADSLWEGKGDGADRRRLSLNPFGNGFELGGVLADIADPPSLKR